MIRKALAALALFVILMLPAVASAEPLTLGQGELLYWTGGATSELDSFQASGRWKLTLGASCFEGIGAVVATIFDANDVEVGRVRVLGEGIESGVFEPPDGEYRIEVFVTNWHVYTWEIIIQESDEELTPVDDHAGVEPAAIASAPAEDQATAAATEARGPDLVAVTDVKLTALPLTMANSINLTTDAFEVSGPFEVTFAAWCHEGVSLVDATLFNQAGEQVGRVRVLGQGVRTEVFDLGPGVYYLEIFSEAMDVYNWELMVTPQEVAGAAPAAPEQAGQAPGAGGAAAEGELSGPLSGVVEIAMSQDGSAAFFDPLGVWVEPGTTIRFVVAEGVHDSQAYHPANAAALQLLRIPEGAEPWNSGLLGGLLNPTGVFEVTLTVEGVYDYFCMPHHTLGMVGRIVVGDPNASPAKPLEEIPYEPARLAFPSVEEIVESVVVHRQAQ